MSSKGSGVAWSGETENFKETSLPDGPLLPHRYISKGCRELAHFQSLPQLSASQHKPVHVAPPKQAETMNRRSLLLRTTSPHCTLIFNGLFFHIFCFFFIICGFRFPGFWFFFFFFIFCFFFVFPFFLFCFFVIFFVLYKSIPSKILHPLFS